MTRDSFRLGATLIASAVFVSGGCESRPSNSTRAPSTVEAAVTGKVTANGMPVMKGKVIVTPPGPPFVERVTDIQKDGSYQIKTYVGSNSFSVVGTGNSSEGGAYNKKDFELKEGANTIDLSLPLTDQ